MVARGDLGVEMALEKVPFIQKSIIERARKHGKFVITATQMLESMIENPFPTRAEVSDIANAIYDGTDAVMLSAETSAGKYPVESARMMAKIAEEAEASATVFRDPPRREGTPSYQETMADMAYRCARMQGATASWCSRRADRARAWSRSTSSGFHLCVYRAAKRLRDNIRHLWSPVGGGDRILKAQTRWCCCSIRPCSRRAL